MLNLKCLEDTNLELRRDVWDEDTSSGLINKYRQKLKSSFMTKIL